MKKDFIKILLFSLGAMNFTGCAPESTEKAKLPSCSSTVVEAFDNIDRRTSLYSKKKSRAHIVSILKSCEEVQVSLNGKSCLVIEPQFKEAVAVSFENIRLTCEAANSY